MNKYMIMKKLVLFVFLLLIINCSKAQQLAFPTAEGIGRFTSGGRGTTAVPTTVFFVTNLSDDGLAGSLRFALTQAATHRTVIFRVSGTIRLNSNLTIRANTTIAGQTAPAGGICIADRAVSLGGNNIILRYIRFRLGDRNQLRTSPANCGVPIAPFTAACMPLNGSGGDDAFSGSGRKNIIIDHCTFGWSNDEACSVYEGDSTTIQWSMISEPLNYSYHFESGDNDFQRHGFGGIWGGRNATFHHNLFAHCKGRTCRFDGSRNLDGGTTPGKENCEFSNNVLYNWGDYNLNGGEGGNYNVRNNYYKFGLSTNSGATRRMIINPGRDGALPWGKYFLSGNFVDGSTANTNNNWLGASIVGGSLADTNSLKVTTAFPNLSINSLETATNAYTSVLQDVGATIPSRDTLDERIVNNVRNRTGRLIDVQGGFPRTTAFNLTINAWPALKMGNVSTDNDNDGMPNWWEIRNGLNQNLASDRAVIASNGYTNLENYLNNIPGWNNHANFTSFTGNKVNSNLAQFNFSTNWVKDSFTYALFRSPDSLGVYTKINELSSSMNSLDFATSDNNLLVTTGFYKIGSYRLGVTPDTIYSNIVRIEGTTTPVKLTAFKATLTADKKVISTWSTALEENVKQFNIQKSYDAQTFETVGVIAPKGSNNNYIFTDVLNNINVNIVYYRLQIVDKDGSVAYSEVKQVSLTNSRNSDIKIFPNPSNGNLNIVSSKNFTEVRVFNYLSQLMFANTTVSNNLQINTTHFAKGIYTLQIITSNKEVLYEKIIVQ
jgi:uncharacterized protein YdeI (BOF family)